MIETPNGPNPNALNADASDKDGDAAPYGRRLLIALLALTAFRIVVLIFAAPELGPDETQYWHWSRAPAAGYYSKPPLIAWAIAASTALFGDGEWAVRLTAPRFHLGAAGFIFLAARRLYDARPGFWAGLSWALMPGVSLSSTLIATDAPLMLFWSAGLFFLIRLIDARYEKNRNRLIDGAGLGLAVGLGFLSKYAAIYFPIGAGLAALFSTRVRRALLSPAGGLALVVAGLVMAPNIAWNAANDFQTLSHTADNANWGGSFVHPLAMAAFIGAQFGVAGPILFALGLLAVGAHARARFKDEPARLLIAFIAPALIIVTAQAFLSRAHANWAAAAYPALIILTAGWAFATPLHASLKRRALIIANALHGTILAVFAVVIVNASAADALGFAGSFKRLRGWSEQGAAVRARAGAYDAVMADDREIMGGLLYYARAPEGAAPTTFVAWNSNNRIDHHYEAFMAFDPARHGRVLYVTTNADAIAVHGRFDEIRPLGETTADLGRGRARTLYLFALEGYRAP